ncbi:MAG: aldo/keto reductase [Aureliella sp.]
MPSPTISLPPIVFGATNLGNLFCEISRDEKLAIVKAWLASPFDPCVIDSAGKYGAGLSLETIGKTLASLDVAPERVVVSNKLGWRRTELTSSEPKFEPGVWKGIKHDAIQDISYDGILRCWEEGDQLLGDYSAQLLSVHDPDEFLAAAVNDDADYDVARQERLTAIIDAYRALSELKRGGRASALGVGSKTWQVVRELSDHCDFDWVMLANSFTILNHPPELVGFLNQLHSAGIRVINSALFHGGFLLGGDFLDYQAIDPSIERHAAALKWRDTFSKLCKQYDVSPFDAGVAFGQSHPAVSSIALSSSRADRVSSHIAAAETELPSEFWKAMIDHRLIDPSYPHLA